ncbi:MAG: AAA family ATPase [Microthrixaceae bacterium]
MRIHRLRLANYRGIEKCDLHFETDGVTVVEGPNEVGKSSIAEAMELVLTERHDTTKRGVRAIQPVGRDVGTEVQIEFSVGPYLLECTKCWFVERRTELVVHEPTHEQLSGREAHERMREILGQHLDESLWTALRVRQGTEVSQARLDSGTLAHALDRAAGGDNAQDDDELFGRITAERDRYWTDSGKLRKEHRSLHDELEDASERVRQLAEELAGLDDDVEAIRRIERELQECSERSDRHNEHLSTLQERSRELDAQRAAVARAEADLEQASVVLELARARSTERGERLTRVGELRSQLDDARSRLQFTEAEVHRLSAEAAASKEEFDQTKERHRAAERTHRGALADRSHIEQLEAMERDRGRLERIDEAIESRPPPAPSSRPTASPRRRSPSSTPPTNRCSPHGRGSSRELPVCCSKPSRTWSSNSTACASTSMPAARSSASCRDGPGSSSPGW